MARAILEFFLDACTHAQSSLYRYASRLVKGSGPGSSKHACRNSLVLPPALRATAWQTTVNACFVDCTTSTTVPVVIPVVVPAVSPTGKNRKYRTQVLTVCTKRCIGSVAIRYRITGSLGSRPRRSSSSTTSFTSSSTVLRRLQTKGTDYRLQVPVISRILRVHGYTDLFRPRI